MFELVFERVAPSRIGEHVGNTYRLCYEKTLDS